MSAMHPSRGWRGCPMCKAYKIRGTGDGERRPFSEVRRLGGTRAIKRGAVKGRWDE